MAKAADKATTHVLVVTDMSGSMAGLAPDVRGGLNSYVAGLRADGKANGVRYRLTVVLFDTEVHRLCEAAKPRDVPDLTEANYRPRAMTALLDAVGDTISRFEEATTLGDEDRVLLVVQTDGAENSSRRYSFDRVREMLDAREKTGRWAILYMGQGMDAWAQGAQFGGSTQVVRTDGTARGVAVAYAGLGAATRKYSAGGAARGVSETLSATPGTPPLPDATDPPRPAPQPSGRRPTTPSEKGGPVSTTEGTEQVDTGESTPEPETTTEGAPAE